MYEIVCAIIMCISVAFLAAGGCILQRDEYWRRVWRNLGEPEVKNIKELKTLRKKLMRNSTPRNPGTVPTRLWSAWTAARPFW